MSAKIENEDHVEAKELQVVTNGIRFLTIIGADVTGAYVAFPHFGLSAKLAVDDVFYNAKQLYDMYPDEEKMWLPEDYVRRYEIAKELSEALTPILGDLYREAVKKFMEERRAEAHAAGLPFSEKPWDGEELDPYVYDDSMSVEDHERMHSLREAD